MEETDGTVSLAPRGRDALAVDGAHRLRFVLRMLWYSPMLAGRLVRRAHVNVDADVERWVNITALAVSPGRRLVALLASYPEFRTLYCYRLRRTGTAGAALSAVLGVLYPGERTLHLATSDIGPGLFIQHGFATIVAARRVGANCWINQQVTIGFDRPGERPVLGDGVGVYAGAKVLGDVKIGDGARIGANAVVLTDVPPGYTAIGVPARLLPPKAEREH
ncbi:MAG TPA: serine acetyltransferase [Acidimicrobiia bacterium]|jgi:serine O-acetyltransferase